MLSYDTDLDLKTMLIYTGGTSEKVIYCDVKTWLSKLEKLGADWLFGETLSKDKTSHKIYSLIGSDGFNDN